MDYSGLSGTTGFQRNTGLLQPFSTAELASSSQFTVYRDRKRRRTTLPLDQPAAAIASALGSTGGRAPPQALNTFAATGFRLVGTSEALPLTSISVSARLSKSRTTSAHSRGGLSVSVPFSSSPSCTCLRNYECEERPHLCGSARRICRKSTASAAAISSSARSIPPSEVACI